jgi:lysylphosphatidylglycerol synthetase-like protein (DUF2156 family)
MTSAAATPSRGAGGRRAEGRGHGLVLFAAILLAVIGCFNLSYGVAAIANSHVFTANAHYPPDHQRAWGLIIVILGILLLLAAAGVWAGNQAARWFAVAVLGLNAIVQLLFIPAGPLWSLAIIGLDLVVLWGLCAYASRPDLAASQHAGVRTASGQRSDADEVGMGFPGCRAELARRPADDQAGWSGPSRLADRSCCCAARPVVKVLIPPAPARPHSADLLLCGHHYLASRAALAAVGASVIDETGEVVDTEPVGCQRS